MDMCRKYVSIKVPGLILPLSISRKIFLKLSRVTSLIKLKNFVHNITHLPRHVREDY